MRLLFVLPHLLLAFASSSNVTVVSGYWRVANKHGNDYDAWFASTLRLNAPYVFFYEEASVRRFVSSVRTGLKTHFIHRPLSAFASRDTYNPAWVHEQHVPSMELGLIWHEKVHCVHLAAQRDVFTTEWFAWVDAGISYYRTRDVPSAPWPAPSILSGLDPTKVYHTHVADWYHSGFAGTAFLYHQSLAAAVVKAFQLAVVECSGSGHTRAEDVWIADWRCGSDQVSFSLLSFSLLSFSLRCA